MSNHNRCSRSSSSSKQASKPGATQRHIPPHHTQRLNKAATTQHWPNTHRRTRALSGRLCEPGSVRTSWARTWACAASPTGGTLAPTHWCAAHDGTCACWRRTPTPETGAAGTPQQPRTRQGMHEGGLHVRHCGERVREVAAAAVVVVVVVVASWAGLRCLNRPQG